jgi:hypothetical protein
MEGGPASAPCTVARRSATERIHKDPGTPQARVQSVPTAPLPVKTNGPRTLDSAGEAAHWWGPEPAATMATITPRLTNATMRIVTT